MPHIKALYMTLYTFYKNHYHELDMLSLFTTYQRKYLYTDDELLLFFIEIIIPPKINLKKILMKIHYLFIS